MTTSSHKKVQTNPNSQDPIVARHKVITFMGREIKQHHLTVCILVALAAYLGYGIMFHDLVRVIGDAMVGLFFDRALAAIEMSGL